MPVSWGLLLKLNPNHPKYVADPELLRNGRLPIGANFGNREYLGVQRPNSAKGSFAGRGHSASLTVTKNGVQIPRYILNQRPGAIISNICDLVDQGVILAYRTDTGALLTADDISDEMHG